MSEVSVIGCGNMGTAIIHTLADAGNHVTTWNRSWEKAQRLAGPRVRAVALARQALEASPSILVSLTSYQATRAVLEVAREALRGRTLVQLSSGLPKEARALGRFVTEAGAAYVDGAILAYPSQVGTDELVILYSGSIDAFEGARPLLAQLGGTALFVGEDPGEAAVRETAVIVPYTAMVVGLWQGAKLCEIEHVPLDWYAGFIQQALSFLMVDALSKAKDRDFATNPEKVQSTVRQAERYTADLVEYLREVGLDAGVFDAIHRLYRAGVEEGRADHDMCCVAELHATPSGSPLG